MRIVVQRVNSASVFVNDKTIGQIKVGLLVFVGITQYDTIEIVNKLASKICNLRIFEDKDGKMNLNIIDIKGEILSISQFTLYGDTKKGNRPSFTKASSKEHAKPLYDVFNKIIKDKFEIIVKKGLFGSHMVIKSVNNGPVTIIMEE